MTYFMKDVLILLWVRDGALPGPTFVVKTPIGPAAGGGVDPVNCFRGFGAAFPGHLNEPFADDPFRPNFLLGSFGVDGGPDPANGEFVICLESGFVSGVSCKK